VRKGRIMRERLKGKEKGMRERRRRRMKSEKEAT
jgi:hypothetical protein